MPPILITHYAATRQLMHSLQPFTEAMSRRSRGEKQQQIDRSFQNLSISSQQTPPEMPQNQQGYPKNTSSQRTYSTSGSTHGGQRRPRSDHNHRDHGHHEPYQHGAMRFPRAPVSGAGDDYSDSGASRASKSTVIHAGHQPRANLSHRRSKHSRGAPGDRSGNYGHERAARDPSVGPSGAALAGDAPPRYCEVENAPLSYHGVGGGGSEASFAHDMVPDKGNPASRACGSEYERSECNKPNPNWVIESDSGSVCAEPGVSWDGSYSSAFRKGYNHGLEDGFRDGFKVGLNKAENPHEDNKTFYMQCRTQRY